MEKSEGVYYIDKNDSNFEIKFGKYFDRVLKKLSDEFGEDQAERLKINVIRYFKEIVSLKNDHLKKHNYLLIGKVQSGKTSNLELLLALAFDNGFKLCVIYGGYDNSLLSQAVLSFKNAFLDINRDVYFVDSSEDSFPGKISYILDIIFEQQTPVVLISMKRPNALNKVNSILKEMQKYREAALIIDDECDQASLNTKANKMINDTSATYREIKEMKKLLPGSVYISTTATAMANVLLNDKSELQPEKLNLIYPGDGYYGLEYFHLNENKVFEIEDEEIIESVDISSFLKKAIYYFFIASAIMRIRGLEFSDMIIHTSRKILDHTVIFTKLSTLISTFKDLTKGGSPTIYKYIKEILKEVFNETYFPHNVIESIEREKLCEEIKNVFKNTFLILQNGYGKSTQEDFEFKKHKIFIGGDLLQRGLRFPNLVTTYFTRWGKSGNMDTTIQRARWLGYRQKYIDLCKIFTTTNIKNSFSKLAETEFDFRDQCIAVVQGDKTIDDLIIYSDDALNLNPTRKNVAKYMSIKYVRNWYNQKNISFDEKYVKKINATVDSLIGSEIFSKSSIGRNDSNISCFYTYIPCEKITNLISSLKEIFDHAPFSYDDIVKLIERYKENKEEIIIQKMFDIEGKKDSRIRSVTESGDTYSISYLQQGPDSSDIEKQNYKGDPKVMVDETYLTIQIFRITPKFNRVNYDNLTQYMFSFHFPLKQKGFRRYD